MKERYDQQRRSAKRRGIPFSLTFDEWCAIWEASGKWNERGTRKGQYVMARFGDTGAYEVSNVRICLAEENHREVIVPHGPDHHLFGTKHSPEWRAEMSALRRGKKLSAEHRAAISAGRLGMTFSEEHRAKLSVSHLGKKPSPEAIAKTAAANRGRKMPPGSLAKSWSTRRAKQVLKSVTEV